MDTHRKLVDILLDTHQKNRSGILRIQKDSVKKQFVIRNGRLAFAESNLPQEHLARILIAMGILPKAKLNDIAASMKSGKTSEEAVLAAGGAAMKELREARREQATMIAASMLGWTDCDFRLYAGDNLLRHQVDLALPLPDLIAAAARYAVSKRLIQAPPNFFSAQLAPAGNMSERMLLFPLTRGESYACSLLDGPKLASEVFSLLPPGELKPEETLVVLSCLGLAQAVASEAPEADPDLDEAAGNLEEMLHQFEKATLYEVLSVEAGASQEEIQAAYHQKAKSLHPDRFQASGFTDEIRSMAEKIFASVNEAYRILRNPASRAEYDQELASGKSRPRETRKGAQNPEAAAESLFQEGKALLAKRDFETAVERFKGCVWLCPAKASYHYYLGLAESEIPRLRKDAEQNLLRAIEIEDVSAESHLALARLYINVDLPRKAELQLHQALLWDPHNAEALKIEAELKKKLG